MNNATGTETDLGAAASGASVPLPTTAGWGFRWPTLSEACVVGAVVIASVGVYFALGTNPTDAVASAVTS